MFYLELTILFCVDEICINYMMYHNFYKINLFLDFEEEKGIVGDILLCWSTYRVLKIP